MNEQQIRTMEWDATLEAWKAESIKQAEEELYGELLASYSEFAPTESLFGEGWRSL